MPLPTVAPEADPLDEVESSAYADLVAAINEGDEAKGQAALKDFVTACVRREMAGEYEAPEEE